MAILIVCAILLIALLTVYVIRESSGFVVSDYTLQSSKLPRDLKIALLTDLHNKDYGDANEPLIRAIDAFSPDVVCFAGDMVTSGWDVSFDYAKTLRFMEKLSKKYPVYYGLGNHEQYFNEDRERFPTQFDDLKKAVSAMGIRFLDNDHAVLEEFHTVIYGLNLSYDYYRKVKTKHLKPGLVPKLLGPVDPDRFSILLAHNPEHFHDYADWNVDLVLSGHVHGGVVRLPLIGGVVSPGIKFFPKYDQGLFHEGQTTMLLSRGIGTHSIPIRINNKAEIVCLTVKGAQDESECKTAGV